jgi:hypothetical protein
MIALYVITGLMFAWLIGLEICSRVRDRRQRQKVQDVDERRATAVDNLARVTAVNEWVNSCQPGLPTNLPAPSCRCSLCDTAIWLGADYLCPSCRLTLV